LKGLAWAALLVAATSGCRDLDRFDTTDGAAYCGSIVSAAFVRESFPPDLRVRLTLDVDRLESVPGTLRTDDGPKSPCTPAPRLDTAPMRVTEAVLHDPLSTFDFGTGRDENFMAWTESCGQPILAVVSLMKNDDVELRLLTPPEPPAAGETEPPPAGFALFQLTRQENDCGF
jgi:hypothetical protein